MEYMKIGVGSIGIGRIATCILVNYDQFVMDCDKFSNSLYEDLDVLPKERFNNKADKICREIARGKRILPSRFNVRLDKANSNCNQQIDYAFELMTKKSFKVHNKEKEFSKIILEECFSSDVDFIMLYVGTSK